MVFYSIASELNDGKVFNQEIESEVKFCSDCDSIIKLSFSGCKSFEPKIKNFDISYSYDGILIVNEKFKEACVNIGIKNIIFLPINKEAKLYALQVNNTVEFDSEARKTRFVNKCRKCGNFESVVGASPPFLKKPVNEKEFEFLSTDIHFGSGRKKHPLIIVNDITKNALEKYQLKGLRFKANQ